MTQFKHTPGPWVNFIAQMSNHNSVAVGTESQKNNAKRSIDDNVVCLISPVDLITDEDVANAKLIATAPDLLEVLSALVKQVEQDCSIGSDQKYFDMLQKVQDAKQAIKKATE